LTPPIVLSVELSTQFIQDYPHCSRKNILLPYPNTDVKWFNGEYAQRAKHVIQQYGKELRVAANPTDPIRPISQFYQAGDHGVCRALRKALRQNYQCAPSYTALFQNFTNSTIQFATQGHYAVHMHLATFCPCPAGDTPSAKRMFDAIQAGCIPVVLSQDYVWPLTQEFYHGPTTVPFGNPQDFALRVPAQKYSKVLVQGKGCQPISSEIPKNALGLQGYLNTIPYTEIQRLRQGLAKAREMYSWYDHDSLLFWKNVTNPLRERILPTGGTARYVVQMLEERASGALWPACQEELQRLSPHYPNATQFQC